MSETAAKETESAPVVLSDRMKWYEGKTESQLPPNQPVILRLDGHAFSKFTAHFARPFDQRIHDAMTATCADLLGHFTSASMAYTQSDEITLVFPSGVGAYSDRVQKIVSLAAAYTTARFNLHLGKAVAAATEPPVRNAEQTLGSAYFDGRVFAVPSVAEALNCVLWKCRGDAIRNSVSAFARSMFTTKELHKKSTAEKLVMMETEKGMVFRDSVPSWAVEGTIIKRETYEVEGKNEKTGEVETALRSRTRAIDKGIKEFSEGNLSLVTDRYWNSADIEDENELER